MIHQLVLIKLDSCPNLCFTPKLFSFTKMPNYRDMCARYHRARQCTKDNCKTTFYDYYSDTCPHPLKPANSRESNMELEVENLDHLGRYVGGLLIAIGPCDDIQDCCFDVSNQCRFIAGVLTLVQTGNPTLRTDGTNNRYLDVQSIASHEVYSLFHDDNFWLGLHPDFCDAPGVHADVSRQQVGCESCVPLPNIEAECVEYTEVESEDAEVTAETHDRCVTLTLNVRFD